jgi:L-amino acid N-acyltransferase YncA
METVRLITATDAEAWTGLYRLAYREAPHEFFDPPRSVEQAKDLLQKRSTYSRQYGVFLEQHLVGMARAVDGDSRFARHRITVCGVFVRKSFRGHGLSRLLLTDLFHKEAARGKEMASIFVEVNNTPARDLYFSLGFIEAGRIEDAARWNGQRFDHLFLDKPLTP